MSAQDFEDAVNDVIIAGEKAAAIQRAYGDKGGPNAIGIDQQVNWFRVNSPSMIRVARSWDLEIQPDDGANSTVVFPALVGEAVVKVMKPVKLPLPGTSVLNPYSKGAHARWYTQVPGVMQQGSSGLRGSDILVVPFIVPNLPPNVIQTLNVTNVAESAAGAREFSISRNITPDLKNLNLALPAVTASAAFVSKFATGRNDRVNNKVLTAGTYYLIIKPVAGSVQSQDKSTDIYISGLASN